LGEGAVLLWLRSSQELARSSQRIELLYLLFAPVGQMLTSFAKIFLEIGRARVMTGSWHGVVRRCSRAILLAVLRTVSAKVSV
jgi:hypothetical protein